MTNKKKEKILTEKPTSTTGEKKVVQPPVPVLEPITRETVLQDGDKVLFIPNLAHVMPLLNKLSQGIEGIILTIDDPKEAGKKLQIVSTTIRYDLLSEELKMTMSARLPKVEVPKQPKEEVKS